MLSVALLILASSATLFGMYYRNVVVNEGIGVSEADNVLFYDMCDYYYRFNERYGVLNPPVHLQVKRFDIQNAISMVTVLTEEPKDIDSYTLLPQPSTTVEPNWNKDNVKLGNMCNWLIKLSQYYMSGSSVARRPRIIAIMTDFVHRYAKAMEGKFEIVKPWGDNWYEFSITSTLMLFYYMIIATNETERTFAANLTLNIIKTPLLSLGQPRDNANSVYMALPWLAAHYYRGDVYKASRDEAYVYALRYIKFPMVTKRMDEGLYIDSTYITHKNVLAYGYLSEMTRMSLPLVGLDNLMRNFLLDWRKCQLTLGHRHIGYGGIGLHARDTRITQFTVPDSAYGIAVIPTCLFLRMYDDEYAFSMRGQVPWIAYYESDKTNNSMAQYWVQCRRVFFKGETRSATFPEIGFIHQKYTDSTEKTVVKSRCVIETRTTTTTPFLCGEKRNTQPLNAGFVFAYGKIGMLRHFYNCPEMVYNRKDQDSKAKSGVYGRYWVDEYVLCDYEKHTIDIWTKITKSLPVAFVLHAEVPVEMDENTNLGVLHMHWDLRKRKLTHKLDASAIAAKDLDKVYPEGITVVNTNNTVMLLDNGKPKMAMYPDNTDDLAGDFYTEYNGHKYQFLFDSLTNQYWVANQCIETA